MLKLFKYITYLFKFYFGNEWSPSPAISEDNDEPASDDTDDSTMSTEQETDDSADLSENTIADEMEMNKYDKVIVCLDNGHGEETPGKRSPYSAKGIPPELPFREYLYCREIVDRLQKVLIEDGFEVFIVTPETWDVTLKERYTRINQTVKEAKSEGKHTLFVSIHNNAAGKGDKWMNAYGWSAWTTRGQNNSDKLAECLYEAADEILPALGQKIRRDKSDGDSDYEANFTIIYHANCPAVLTENMFQDCAKEVEFLLTEEGKNAIVEIHRRGIEKFVDLMEW